MSEQTITISYTLFKTFDQKLQKVSRLTEELDILGRKFNQLSKIIAEVDTLIFALREEFEELKNLLN